MFRWGVAKKLRLAIVLDEAHRLARDITLPKLMKERRKFGISVPIGSAYVQTPEMMYGSVVKMYPLEG